MDDKIDLSGVFSLGFIKKTRYTGSFHSMRYLLDMVDGKISATVYPGPYCFEATPDKEKETQYFEFSNDGLKETVAWLNQVYDGKYREKDLIEKTNEKKDLCDEKNI